MKIGVYADDPGLVDSLSRALPERITWAAGQGLKDEFAFPVFQSFDEAQAYQTVDLAIDCIGDLPQRGILVVPVEGALFLLGAANQQPGSAYLAAAAQLDAGLEKMGEQLALLQRHGNKLTQVGSQLEETSSGIAADLERTGRILDSISRIAKRSKIIGLNSAIEAARVGELGKGFAVVAEEIKSLADDSSQSIMGIERILEGIHRRSEEFLTGTGAVSELSGSVQQATAGITVLLESIKELGQHLKKLAKENAAVYSLTN